MKRILSVILLSLSVTAAAEDGLVIQLTIDEKTIDGSKKSQYINALLLSYPGTSVSRFPDQYEVKFQVDTPKDNIFDLVFTLKDLSSGNPYYVGATPVSVKVGESRTVTFERNSRIYNINLDTSFGELP
ncbi:hypothetical protein [Gilvimarinus algae]|uniref:Uncharacterized protein n=1 Tax=Gilvimarinus algae TaxID=3058037 RepID=A0ABT8TGU0_9GAMM|nr:hypothetical protein [Gilvimarinus sp. SDUM040014]MDO3383309.1 hypothetical protein [Gilvimarinus sp. SDUM040014]